MIDLVFSSSDIAEIRTRLVGHGSEACAIAFANRVSRKNGNLRLLVHELEFPRDSEYTRRGSAEAELAPSVVANVTKRARSTGSSLVFIHSHPGDRIPLFSATDNEGETHLSDFLSRRHPNPAHAALVIGASGVRCRVLGTQTEVRVVSIGENYDVLFDPYSTEPDFITIFERQIRAFGIEGQKAISRLRVGIVGLGGVGSLVAQELAHLGVSDFVLIDPDVLEETNLNRVANATAAEVGRQKVGIAAKYIRRVNSAAQITEIDGDVIHTSVSRELLEADIIFGCTDSHGSRAIINQIAYQYLIPLIDLGTTIAVRESRITHIYGRVQLLSPGLACLTCSNLLDPREVRTDMMTAFERKDDPYIQGVREPAPAVMSLNATVASLGVTMFLSMVTGLPVKGRYLLYNAMASTLRHSRAEHDPICYVCSRQGSLARGDKWPLPGRED